MKLAIPTLIACLSVLQAITCDRGGTSLPGEQPPSPRPGSPTDPSAKTVSPASPPGPRPALDPESLARKAQELAHRFLIVDGHIDVPMRVSEAGQPGRQPIDISTATADGDFDVPRAQRGGLNAPFMSIYTPASYENNGAKKHADALIDLVRGWADKWPDTFALAPSPQAVRINFAAGKISLPMGMENGAPLEGKLENIAYFHQRGIRYITLAHSKDNHISDSSYDDRHTHKGLSAFGKTVVAEMNRVGVMIDVSHISDDAFRHVMEITKTPVIASHSSCRHFTPGWERNMDDGMIQRLRDNGGVLQINFGSSFILERARVARESAREEIGRLLAARQLDSDSDEADPIKEAYYKRHPRVFATVEDVADHIDHAVGLASIEHVGLGSDFDGVGDSLPKGLKDVAAYPRLFAVLLSRGYSESDIEKLAGANALRVWSEVEAHARDNGS
ncbi:MAG: membrane dipeptidase [Nannocystaceae bacterium]